MTLPQFPGHCELAEQYCSPLTVLGLGRVLALGAEGYMIHR